MKPAALPALSTANGAGGYTPEAPPVPEEPHALPGIHLVELTPPAAEPPPAAVNADRRLQTKISVTEKDRTLRELLPVLSRLAGVRLTAGNDVADDRASLFLKERPAGEVLTLLARHFDFRWYRKGEGYELVQDRAAKKREDALRKGELAPIEAQLNLATRLTAWKPEQLQDRIKELDAQLQAPGTAEVERARLTAEKQVVIDVLVSAPAVTTSLTLFRGLSAEQIDEILAGGELRFSSANGTLSAELAERIHETTASLAQIFGDLPKLQADATIRLTDGEEEEFVPPTRRRRQLHLECKFTTLRGTRKEPRNWGSRWSPALPAPAAGQSSAGAAEGRDPALRTTVELELPGPERQPPPIVGGSLSAQAATGTVWGKRATVGDVAQALFRATGLEVVTDGFVGARIDPALLRGWRTVASVLDTLANEQDYSWSKRGKLVLLRDRRYYLDRPAEAPDRLVRPFRQRVLKAGRLGLDDLAGLTAALTDPQVHSLGDYWGWYLEDSGILPADWLFTHRQHLRFWAALSPAQRAEAAAGGGLPVARMTPGQQRLWLQGLSAPPESASTPAPEQPTPTAAEVGDGGFRLKTAEAQQLLYLHTSDDGKRRLGNTLSVEGPATLDVRKFMSFDPPSSAVEPAGPQHTLDVYHFSYHLGGKTEPVRAVSVRIPRLMKVR